MENKHGFKIKKEYSRKDVLRYLNIEEEVKGIYTTGYFEYEKDFFCFVNVDTKGVTGPNYNNVFIEEKNILIWQAKTNHSANSKLIKKMLEDSTDVYFFLRNNNKNTYFTFLGIGEAITWNNNNPVTVLWSFDNGEHDEFLDFFVDEETLTEGNRFLSTYSRIERSREARKKCLDYYGYTCCVCNFNFTEHYGELGKDFIHVHHLMELSSYTNEHIIDPIKELRPVCPNCHSMLHRNKNTLSIEKLKHIIESVSK